MNVRNAEAAETTQEIFSYGASYRLNNREVAHLGLVRPDITKMLELKAPVFYADLDWDYLVKQYSAKAEYREVPKFPEVRRDLSLVLDRPFSFGQIELLARKQERRLLKEINIFDVYEGENLGTGKKSYSVSFILQDENQT